MIFFFWLGVQASEVAQWVRGLATTLDDPSWIPRTPMVEGKTNSPKLPSGLHMQTMVDTHLPTHPRPTHTLINVILKFF